jgi:hypothetical protein
LNVNLFNPFPIDSLCCGAFRCNFRLFILGPLPGFHHLTGRGCSAILLRAGPMDLLRDHQESPVTVQSRVASRYGLRSGVKAKWFPGWGSGRSAWNHEALISSWRGRGPRPPASHRGGSGLSPSLYPSRPMLPVRTPRPKQNLHRAPRH